MYNISSVIEDLSYGKQIDKLCCRILKLLEIREDKTLDYPACVTLNKNMIILKYNPNLFTSYDEFKFALKHEALHIAFGDLFINFQNYDMEFLNMALDARINTYIMHDPKMFTTILDLETNKYFSGIENIRQKTTWQACYEALKRKSKENEDQHGKSQNGEKGQETDNSGSNEKGDIKDKIKNIDNHTWEEKEEVSVVHESILQDELINAIEELEINIGSELGKNIIQGLEYFRVPRDKWRKKLTQSIVSFTKIKEFYDTYNRFNRRLYDLDFRLPAKKAVYYPTIAVVIDTSNSMAGMIPKVLGHIATISNENGVIDYLIAGDTEVRTFMKNVKKSKINNIVLEGFGGTILSPMIKKVASLKNIDITIFITDFFIIDSDIQLLKQYVKKHNTILCIPKSSKALVDEANIQKCKFVFVDKDD